MRGPNDGADWVRFPLDQPIELHDDDSEHTGITGTARELAFRRNDAGLMALNLTFSTRSATLDRAQPGWWPTADGSTPDDEVDVAVTLSFRSDVLGKLPSNAVQLRRLLTHRSALTNADNWVIAAPTGPQ